MMLVQDRLDVEYADVANAVIQRFSVIVGSERALRLAANVDGLELDQTNRAVAHASQESLDRLVREYQSVGGMVAVLLMKRTVAPVVNGSGRALPASLR